jgi:NAD(P)-dependent dehydrogenase (short-subunit alcohol dehydrogenase family)
VNIQDLTKLYDFSGKTFVVTGGTGVLGGELACHLLDLGANVVIFDRSLETCGGLGEYTHSSGWRAKAVGGDVLNRESLLCAAEAIKEEYGPVYGLVNAAGGNKAAATTSADLSFFDLSEDAQRSVLDLNLLGTMLPCQIFGKQLAERGEGVILNYSSMNAYRPLTNIPAYAATKAGITNFTSWLATHMAMNYSGKIRVNAIAPGFFLGEQNRYLLTDKETGELTARGRKIIDHTPMGRFGMPEDLIGTSLWLLSPASAFVTGITVPVDGGFSAYSGV